MEGIAVARSGARFLDLDHDPSKALAGGLFSWRPPAFPVPTSSRCQLFLGRDGRPHCRVALGVAWAAAGTQALRSPTSLFIMLAFVMRRCYDTLRAPAAATPVFQADAYRTRPRTLIATLTRSKVQRTRSESAPPTTPHRSLSRSPPRVAAKMMRTCRTPNPGSDRARQPPAVDHG